MSQTKQRNKRRKRTVAGKGLRKALPAELRLAADPKAKPPVCADYGDAARVREYELAVRRYRAAAEPFVIVRVAAGSFAVAGGTGQYTVDIVRSLRRARRVRVPGFCNQWARHMQAPRGSAARLAAWRKSGTKADGDAGRWRKARRAGTGVGRRA